MSKTEFHLRDFWASDLLPEANPSQMYFHPLYLPAPASFLPLGETLPSLPSQSSTSDLILFPPYLLWGGCRLMQDDRQSCTRSASFCHPFGRVRSRIPDPFYIPCQTCRTCTSVFHLLLSSPFLFLFPSRPQSSWALQCRSSRGLELAFCPSAPAVPLQLACDELAVPRWLQWELCRPSGWIWPVRSGIEDLDFLPSSSSSTCSVPWATDWDLVLLLRSRQFFGAVSSIFSRPLEPLTLKSPQLVPPDFEEEFDVPWLHQDNKSEVGEWAWRKLRASYWRRCPLELLLAHIEGS